MAIYFPKPMTESEWAEVQATFARMEREVAALPERTLVSPVVPMVVRSGEVVGMRERPVAEDAVHRGVRVF